MPAVPPSALEAGLRADVRRLCHDIGERSYQRPAGLVQAADWLAAEFARAGLAVTRPRYAARGGPFENVVGMRGGRPGLGMLVVGAHYDSYPGTVGADDNASGVAALLAIARALAQTPTARPLRFVAYASEETHFQTPEMGAFNDAQAVAHADPPPVGMLSLETLGTYDDAPGSQRFPLDALAWAFPDRGNFVAFVGNPASRGLLGRAVGAFRAATPFPSEGAALPAAVPGVAWSDHWAYWEAGLPALMATDTAPFRNPRYHTPQDTPERLDYPHLAEVTRGLLAVVTALAAE